VSSAPSTPTPADAAPTVRVDYVELLRECSEATSLIEHGVRLLERMRSLFGVELFLNFIAVEGHPGVFQVLSVMDLPDGPLDMHEVLPGGKWCQDLAPPAQDCTLLRECAQHDRPVMLTLSDDLRGAASLDGRTAPRHALVLPIFRGGRAHEWVVFFRSAPWDLGESDLVLLMQIANMMGLAGEREELVERVSALNERLTTSLASILQAQRSIMPPAPPLVEGLRFAVWYEPSEEVGGDYYDFRDFGDGQFGAVVADVSGHGPPASVAMGMLRSVLLAYRAFGRPASTVVTDVNRVLYESFHGDRFVTAIFVGFYPKNGRFVYANAGHHVPRVRRRDGRVEPITGNASPPLGILEHLDTVGAAGQLQPGECMVLYTDGVIEAFDEHREQFGVQRLDEAIAHADPDPDAIAEAIRVAVGAFSEEQVVDDRCVLVVKREP
jgi:sigma-B regulation protein RsbU (phosphoserine phosphatase)